MFEDEYEVTHIAAGAVEPVHQTDLLVLSN